MELPNVTFIEPAYAVALDWLLCGALQSVAAAAVTRPGVTQPGAPGGGGEPTETGSYYFRLTTRGIDQAPFQAARDRLGDAADEAAAGAPPVYLVGCGAVLPEVLTAAAELADEGIAATVVDVTSPDRLYRAWQRTLRQGVRTATAPSIPGAIRSAFGHRAPVVTVHDAASHTMSWLGSALGVPAVSLGVDSFGQSGAVADLYRAHDLDSGSIVNAALAALSLR
jgi:pyruvate dehydrogenase E1 component